VPYKLQLTPIFAVKALHSLVWALFAGCIIAIPVFASHRSFRPATWLAGAVAAEVLALVLNRWRCPLASIAARYTNDRRENFDIFLPNFLARHNKFIFGTLYVTGLVYTIFQWLHTHS
jgi:hypothetical protein